MGETPESGIEQQGHSSYGLPLLLEQKTIGFRIRSNSLSHRGQLEHRSVLLLDQIGATVFDLNLVPGKNFVGGSGAMGIEIDINPKIFESAPPTFGIEVLAPGVESSPTAPVEASLDVDDYLTVRAVTV